MAGLHFDITGDNSNFLQKLEETRNGVRAASKQIEESGMSIEQMFGRMAKGAAALGAGFSAQQFVSQVMKVRGEFQQLEVAFNTMLGSEEKANTLMQQLVKTAATTPFDLQSVAGGAKQLLAYGTAAEDVNGTLIRLGDIAAGLSIPLGDLVYLYGTTMSQGRLYTQDLNQFTGRGIPMIGELAKQFGVAESEVKKLVESGRVGFPEVQKVIESLTNEGGKFGGLMEAQSKTITGQISNIEDAIDTMYNNIGKSSEGFINEALSGVSYLVENYEEVGKVIMELIAIYGTYKAILITITALQKVNSAVIAQAVVEKRLAAAAEITLSNAEAIAIAKTKLLTIAQQGLIKSLKAAGVALAANPYIIAAAAIAGMSLAIYKVVTAENEFDKANKRLNDSIKEAEKGTLSEQRELAKLKGELSATTKGTDEYNKIRDKIVSNYGKYDKNLKDEIDRVGLLDTTYQNLTKSIQQSFNVRQYDKFKQEQSTSLDDVMSDNLDSMYDKLVGKWGDELGAKYYTEIKNALMAGEEIPKHLNKVVSNMYGIWAQSLHGYINNIREAQKATEDADKKARIKFGIDDGSGNEDGKDDGTKKELSSVSEEIKTVTANIAKLKQQIKDLRSGKTTVEVGKTVQQTIEDKTKELKAAEDALATLTGKDKSSLKEASDLLKLQQDLSRSILDSELKLQAGRIAAMEDGKAKRMALAKQEYDEARAQIDKEEQDLLSKKGITKDQKKIVSDNANSLRLQEQQNLLKKNTDIEKTSAKEIQSIWADVNSRFSSGLENRLTEIDSFYEEAIKKAREEGVEEIKIAELISKAKEEKASVKNESFIEEGMQRIAMEEEVAQKHLEIKQDQFVTDSVYQLKRNSLERKFTLDRLNLLKRSIAQEGTERYRQIEDEKKQLSGHLTYLDEYGETLKGEIIQDALSGLSDIAGAIGGLNDDLGETMNNLQQMIGAMAQLASGNYIGAAISAITSVVSSIAKSNQEAIQRAKETEGHYWDAVNWKIERQIELMKELQGISSDQVNQSIQTQIDELMDILYNADFKYKGKSGAEMQWMVENLLGGYKKAVASGNKLAQKVLEGMANGLEGNLFGDKKFDDVLKGLTTEELISLQGIPDVWKVLPEEVQQYIKQLSDAVDKQKELTDTTNEMFTGTAENEIANSILDALSKGKDGVDDFSAYFKDMMKKAMLEGVKMNYLQKPIKDFYKQFSAMSQSDEKLTKTEIDELREMYQQIVDNAQAQFENLKDISGLDFSTPEEGESDNTLKGAYAKASQESITLIAGQFGHFGVVLEDIKNSMIPIREQMLAIREMNAEGWEDVKAIRDLSDKVEKNTSRIAENTQEIKTVADKISDNTKRTVETLEGTIDVKVKM